MRDLLFSPYGLTAMDLRKAPGVTASEPAHSADAGPTGVHTAPEPQPDAKPTPLLWLTVLSLDAPAVAVLWQLLFARTFHVQIAAGVTVLLALVVWLIYVADRALDTLKAPAGDAEAARHIFYRRHLWAFAAPFCAGLALAAWMALTQLDAWTFRYGLILLLAVGVYFFAVHRLLRGQNWLPKEMMVGVLFALGTCFPVWQRMPQRLPLLAPYLIFTGLCWMNCAAIEFEEWKRLRHRKSGAPHPWTVWMGRRFSLLCFIIGVSALGSLVFAAAHSAWQLPASELLSAFAFALIWRQGESLSIDRFRVLMDVALFTPVLFIFL
jgi:hypothetical protein